MIRCNQSKTESIVHHSLTNTIHHLTTNNNALTITISDGTLSRSPPASDQNWMVWVFARERRCSAKRRERRQTEVGLPLIRRLDFVPRSPEVYATVQLTSAHDDIVIIIMLIL